MAPELLNGGGRAAAAPADIFAFGLIMHELLTGRPAFEAPPVFLAVHGLKPPTLPDGIARMVVALFDRCLLVDPSQRPTAQAVVDALHAART